MEKKVKRIRHKLKGRKIANINKTLTTCKKTRKQRNNTALFVKGEKQLFKRG